MLVTGSDVDKNLAVIQPGMHHSQLPSTVSLLGSFTRVFGRNDVSSCKEHLFNVYVAFAIVSKTIMPHSLEGLCLWVQLLHPYHTFLATFFLQVHGQANLQF